MDKTVVNSKPYLQGCFNDGESPSNSIPCKYYTQATIFEKLSKKDNECQHNYN